ncbi:MetQ/NlpA family ABC transporter substrate-binding protein [Paenirhodobacter sp.]|uniref:MetQ/NlpA family ABC transporter substrate-binding protein n=1 Tax=Paenirhodobacter sp. TaxID=1965326 RepID=UPI003B3FB2D9
MIRMLSLGLVLMTGPCFALNIGVTPGALADSVETAAREARAQGLNVTITEFSDWTTPNVALANGDLDANYFQHQAFLDNANREGGFGLVSAGIGLLPNIGLYSEKYSTIDELPDGARVAVANDPVNQGRGLALLQSAGLITLRAGVGANGTLDDITENPKHVQIIEIEGPQLVRALSDVDLAQGYPAHFVNAGKPDIAGRALLYSGAEDDYFAIRFVTRADHRDDPDLLRFIRIYQTSEAVRETISASYARNPALYTLPWLN